MRVSSASLHRRVLSAMLALAVACAGIVVGPGVQATAQDGLTVVTVPWRNDVPHPTYNGVTTVLKAIVRNADVRPVTYRWSFGDGSPAEEGLVTDAYCIEARHTYPPSTDGTPYTAVCTVTDAAGNTASDSYRVIVRAQSPDVEADKAIDDGLWYLHKRMDRYLPGPTFAARPNGDGVIGWEWAPDDAVHVAIDDLDADDLPNHELDAPTDEWGSFDLWEIGYDIMAGYTVTVSQGSVSKTHVITSLEVTSIDPANDIVSGTAAAGSEVEVYVWTDEEDRAAPKRAVTADGAGEWSADFSNPADTGNPDEDRTWDITPGSNGMATQYDEDRDATEDHWSAPRPRFAVTSEEDDVCGWEWAPNDVVHVAIDDLDADDIPNHESDVPTDDEGNFYAWMGGYDIMAGYTVTVSQGTVSKTHVITSLEVTSIDPANDIVSGTAAAGSEVDVYAWTDEEERAAPKRTVTADGAGEWSADFSNPADTGNPDEDRTRDIVLGSSGMAEQDDEDGDATQANWRVRNPTFATRPNNDGVGGGDWSPNDTVHVAIDDLDADELPNHEFDEPTNEWGDFDLWEIGYDIMAGYTVTVSQGSISKTHVVTGLQVTQIDPDNDVVSGTAEAGSDVDVYCWTDEPDRGAPRRAATANAAGEWSADFSNPADTGNPDEDRTWDIAPGSNGMATQYDEDGDSTEDHWGLDAGEPTPGAPAQLAGEPVDRFDAVSAETERAPEHATAASIAAATALGTEGVTGIPPYGFWGYGDGNDVGITGMCIEAFEVQGHLPGGDYANNPYVETVQRGLNYLLSNLEASPLELQPAGDPDSNGNGIGLGLQDWEQMYRQPIALMALAASLEPGRIAEVGTPDVSGRTYADIAQDMVDYIAWAQNETPSVRDGIMVYDLATGEKTTVAAGRDKSQPDISNDYVVWTDYRDMQYDIYAYDLAAHAEIRVTDDPTDQWQPAVSGSRIVWTDRRNGNGDIYLYDVETGVETPLVTDPSEQQHPAIWGDTVVWTDYRTGNPDIYALDIVSGTQTQLTTDSSSQTDPAVYGDLVAWSDSRNGNGDVYARRISGGPEFAVTTDPGRQYAPSVTDGTIVWTDYRAGNPDIYGYDVASATEFPVVATSEWEEQADIDGSRVVYTTYASGEADVLLHDFVAGTDVEIDVGMGDQYEPAIWSDLVVWTAVSWNDPNARGGWRYGPNYGSSDNSVSQWPVIALLAAQSNLGVTGPPWVRTELAQWLSYSQNHDVTSPEFGGFGYSGPQDWVNVAKTGAGIAGLSYIGAGSSDARIQEALAYLDRNWDLTGSSDMDNFGNYYGMYAVMKGMRVASPQIATVGSHDWYAEYARYLVDNQQPDGSWPVHSWGDEVIDTAWSLLILTPSVVSAPPVAVISPSEVTYGPDVPVLFSGLGSYHLDPQMSIVGYEWDFDGDGVWDASGPTAAHSFPTHYRSDGTVDPDATYRDYVVTLRISDDANPPNMDSATAIVHITPPPHPPIADANGPYSGAVGVPVALDGSGSFDLDALPPSDDHIVSYGWELDGEYPYDFDDATGVYPSWTWGSEGIKDVGLRVTDSTDLTNIDWTTAIIAPAPADSEGPLTYGVLATANPSPINRPIAITACVDDLLTGGSRIATAQCSLDNGDWTPCTAADGAFDAATENVCFSLGGFTEPGVHTVAVRGTDEWGNVGDPFEIMVVAYDPSAGFVSGGGWIDSPAGAYVPDSSLTGRATFGFVSRYKKGASTPDGSAEFQFTAGDLNFHSNTQQWLVVNKRDGRAQFKCSGTINGEFGPGSDPFDGMIWAEDGTGPDGADTFRIKIWFTTPDGAEVVLYDNASMMPIAGGSVVVHAR